jgi:hypothetical protein
MKTIIEPTTTFTPSSRTLDFSAYGSFDIKKLYAVINLTAQTVIYAVGGSGTGYSSISGGNILTLQYNTTTMSSGDTLQIIYDDATAAQVVSGLSAVGTAPGVVPVPVSGIDGGGLKRHFLMNVDGTLRIDGSAVTQPVSVTSLPLAAGAATSSNQTSANTSLSTLVTNTTGLATSTLQNTGNTSLASLDTKTPALGNSNTAGSTPVTMSADSATATLGALNATVQVPCTGSGTGIIQISGTWVGTVIFEGSNDNFVTSQAITSVYLGGLATQSSSWTTNGFYTVLTAGFKKLQARMSAYTSGTAVIAADTTAATRVIVPIQGNAANLQMTATQGPAGASAWKVDGSAVTQPISAAALPLPIGAATSANQATEITSLATIATNSATQATSALQTTGNTSLASIATQTNIATNGAATSALQTSGNASLSTIATNSGTQATAALQTSGNASLTTIATNSATQATAGNQTLGNASLATIVTNTSAPLPSMYVTGQSAQTATVNNILTVTAGATATDLTGYYSASVQVVSTGTGGTFIFEGSNDNVNFQTIPVFNQLVITGTPITAAITATSSQIVYTLPITTRYVRLRIATTITGGSIQAFSIFKQVPWSPAVMEIAQATAANLNVSSTQNGNWTNRTADGTGALITSTTLGSKIGLNTQLIGRSIAAGSIFRQDYTITSVTTAAYTQVIASTPANINEVEIFDSSGQTLVFAVGGAGSEVNQFYIFPGGNGRVPLYIPGGSRVAIKAISTNAAVGEIDINFYQ